ncbi:YitT family protein [Rhodobacteraceae bacterium CCMM004]|nr:YitT family protein [Rhodobacteraceae bacterium CCMM004]
MVSPANTARHTPIDDVQGLGLGVFLCGLGLHVLTHAGLLTGQTAGVAVIVSYLTGWSFGAVFFAINLPFYVLAWRRLGPVFTLKSLVSVTLLSLVTEILPAGIRIDTLDPGLAAVIFGALTGTGLLVLFRHNGSLGGIGVVALLLQDTTGVKAGHVQLGFDALLFAVAATLFPWPVVAWSLAGAVVMNLIIAVNHRRDRYVAT